MARVTHRYEQHDEYISKWSGSVLCRAPGQNSRWRKADGEHSKFKDERGEKTAVMPVSVYIRSDTGKFVINVHYPDLTAKWHSETKDAPAGGCQNPDPTIIIFDGEENFKGNYKELSGQIDPKNPTTLSGKEIKGDIETGQETWTWNLRLVTPNQKKALK